MPAPCNNSVSRAANIRAMALVLCGEADFLRKFRRENEKLLAHRVCRPAAGKLAARKRP